MTWLQRRFSETSLELNDNDPAAAARALGLKLPAFKKLLGPPAEK
jgi:hypothetical protein